MSLNSKNNNPNLLLRTATATDEEFSKTVYADSRRGELAPFGWTRVEENAFFEMQFQMQKNAYRMQFPDAIYTIIEEQNEPIGRLITERRSAELRLIDITLITERRNRGVGAFIIEKLKSEAEKEGKFLSLRVLKNNKAAIRFYERHGLTISEDAELHYGMRWNAPD